MTKTIVIPKIQHFHPGKAAGFKRFLNYLETRPSVMEQPTDNNRWVNCGLGSTQAEIRRHRDDLQSRKVLGRQYVIAPDPELLAHLLSEARAEAIGRTTEATMRKWFADNEWGMPEFSYVLHDKEKGGMPMMHAHIITPGTMQPDPDLPRMPHFVNKPQVYDLHASAASVFEAEFARLLGRNRAQHILRERAERLAREARERWAVQQGIQPHSSRGITLGKAAALARLIRQRKQEKKRIQLGQALKQFAKAQRAARQNADREAARAARAVKSVQWKAQRQAEQENALEQARARHRARVEKMRSPGMGWLGERQENSVGQDIEYIYLAGMLVRYCRILHTMGTPWWDHNFWPAIFFFALAYSLLSQPFLYPIHLAILSYLY